MNLPASFTAVLLSMGLANAAQAEDWPYLTTRSPITLLSANDGEIAQLFQLTDDQTTDWKLKTKDSFTVIHLGPDHPPIIRTVYDTVPATIKGTPTMALSRDGRYGLIANHGLRTETDLKIQLPPGPRTNADLTPEMLRRKTLTAQFANLISLIDLSDRAFPVVHRVLLDDCPVHVLRHPDGERFVVGATENFYVFRIVDGKLVEVSRNPHPFGLPCFWIHPQGNRIIATHSLPREPLVAGKRFSFTETCTVQWFSIEGDSIKHLSEVKVQKGVDTKLTPASLILRVSPDGRLALICQRAGTSGRDMCDILVADLTLERPAINGVVKQVADGVESFAFHPNGKMAVATGLGTDHNCIAVLDVAVKPIRLLYTLDAKGLGQGIEFTPEGDKLFVGSALAGRIEVFDVLGDYGLRKNPYALNVGFGHSSLSIGPRYRPTK